MSDVGPYIPPVDFQALARELEIRHGAAKWQERVSAVADMLREVDLQAYFRGRGVEMSGVPQADGHP